MSQPVYVYVGTYPNEEGATEDLAVVKALYKGDAIETYGCRRHRQDPGRQGRGPPAR